VCIEVPQYPCQIYNHNVTGQNIQMLIADVDPLCTALLVLSSFCPYLCLSFCPSHHVLSPSYCLLNLHPPKNKNKAQTVIKRYILYSIYLLQWSPEICTQYILREA